MLKLLGPALRKINVEPQDLDGATIAELTERCAQPLPADGTGCRIPALQADLDFIPCRVPTDAAADLPSFRPRLSDCSLGTWLCAQHLEGHRGHVPRGYIVHGWRRGAVPTGG